MLLVWLTLPVLDEQGAEDILDFVTDLHLSSVTDKLGRSSPFTDVVFEGINELLVHFNTVDISNMGVGTIEDDSGSRAIINCRSIRINNVTGDGF